MATSFGPGSLWIPFPSRRRYQEENPLEAKGPKRLQEACRLAAALMTVAATEPRSCQQLVQGAAAGDATAMWQVAAACRILALLSI